MLKTPLPGLSRTQRFLVKMVLFTLGSLIKSEHAERLTESEDRVIFAFNHNSSYETFVINAFIHYKRGGRKVGFLVDWMYGYSPVIGWIIRQVEPIFVYGKPAIYRFMEKRKEKLDKKPVIDSCLERINQNKGIAIFPEGTRNKDPYVLKKGKLGLAKLVLMTDIQVIPVGIDFPLRQKKGKIPKLGRIIFRVGEPMYFHDEYARYNEIQNSTNQSKDQKQNKTNELYNHITREVMLKIADLSNKEYPFK